MQSQLGNEVLGKVWQFADVDKDGFMTDQEFALCLFLLDSVKAGQTLPDILPIDHIPPRFRQQVMKQRKLEQQQQQMQQQQQPQTSSTTQQGGLPPPTDSAW